MGRCSASAVAVVAALAVTASAAAPAGASHREPEVVLKVSKHGSAAISWHGDSARGCADAGLCGYRGSVTTRAGDEGPYDSDGTVILGFGDEAAETDVIGPYGEPPVPRVLRTEADGTQSGCTDTRASNDPFLLSLAPRRGKRLRVGLALSGQVAGRCAGPRIDDKIANLPARTIRIPRGGRSVTVTLNGRLPYSSGRFSGTVVSRLKVRLRRLGSSRFPLLRSHAPHPRAQRIVHLSALYRISGLSGASDVAFEGLPEPSCFALDACGASGSTRWSIDGAGADLVIEGDAEARRSERGVAGAWAAITRDDGGAVLAFAFPHRGAAGTTSAELHRPDGVTCRDSQPAPAPALVGAIRNGRFQLAFDVDDQLSPVELLRTGCPGPLGADVGGGAPGAVGGVPIGWLARRRTFEMRLGARGSFAGLGYRGTHETALGFKVERVSAKATYRNVP